MSTKNKRIHSPDEIRSFENGKVEVVNLGGFSMCLMTLQPGWKWSRAVKPIAKTEDCKMHHIGFVISGRLKVVTRDGKETELQPGSVYEIIPGHDAWVVGGEPFVALELSQDTVANYAKPL
ncbi:MAG: cupin domain-containing protein [Candidatus Caldarchaeum sp.]|jgi:mannose-6-phosphate isomerase-like protein (cupin superfamily)